MCSQFNGPFQVYTGDGRRIVLPNSFADEIRDNENMSFGESAIEVMQHDVLPLY